MAERDAAHWAAYNDGQAGRAVRALCAQAIALAGPGAGRAALDLGCGAGLESRALLAAGWRVHAIDSAPGTAERVRATTGAAPPGLTVEVIDLAAIERLPAADLVYSGYSLQYLPPAAFERLWRLIRQSLRPKGWIAVNLLGDRDSWAGTDGETFLDEGTVRGLFEGLEILQFDEEDADGPAYGGTKHWHVFDVVARRPTADR